MSCYSGADLLKVFDNLKIDLGNLNPNVIKGWFDTDCKDTIALLNWMCCFSEKNYVAALEQAEYAAIEQIVEDEQTCIDELKNLRPEYADVLHVDKNLEDIVLLESEIEVLQAESNSLDRLLQHYEYLNNKLSIELTNTTAKEIESKARCATALSVCINLSERLDGIHTKIEEQLITYDPDSHFVNQIDLTAYRENIDNLKSCLSASINLEQTQLENLEESLSDELEMVHKRLIQSNQIYLANNIEISKLQAILKFLHRVDISHIDISFPIQSNFQSMETYKRDLCEMLNGACVKQADHYIIESKVKYLQMDLDEYRSKLRDTSKILEHVTKFFSYYALTNVLQTNEKACIDMAKNFFVNIRDYVNGDLSDCKRRIDQMNEVINEHQLYRSKPDIEKLTLVSSMARVLSGEASNLNSALEAICKFKSELNSLEAKVFRNDFYEDKNRILQRKADVEILEKYFQRGPTDRVILMPVKLQNAFLEMEDHFRMERASLSRAVQIPKTARNNATKEQNYIKQLWMIFLTKPAKVESLLKKVEAEFNQRTREHFF
ncbi:uncharacterized protein LOC132708136 [Cylas formicarius]|uniref:uncharacterized protein LOC132708136 n=1 Tax=Cylas formicarius TaxID=197179 RepID=UPI002958B828|nr:uncharacterized protein LOC132708136 [Cylas formicarius]